jgi:glyoxylate carboligase
MKFNLIFLLIFAFFNINAESINEYSAKYFYTSDEISIKGIRKLEINDGKYSFNFKAKNLLASMMVGSEIKILYLITQVILFNQLEEKSGKKNLI